MAGLLDLFINQYLAKQQAPGLQNALFGTPSQPDIESQIPGGTRTGGLLGDQGQQFGNAFSQIDPRISVPIMQKMLSFQADPQAQVTLQSGKLANRGAELGLIPQEFQTQAWQQLFGGAQGGPQSPQAAPQGPTPQSMGMPGTAPTGLPALPPQAPLTRSSAMPGLPPGVTPLQAMLMGPQGIGAAWQKFTGPQKFSGGEGARVLGPDGTYSQSLGDQPKLPDSTNYDPSARTINPVPGGQFTNLPPSAIGALPGTTALGTIIQQAPGTGQISVIKPSDLKSPAAAEQDVSLAGRTAAASATGSAGAKAAFMLPPNDPRVQSWVRAITQNGAFQGRNVPEELKTSVAAALPNDPSAYAPAAKASYMSLASDIAKPYVSMKAYTLTQDGAPMLGRISAAMQNPGSVSDQELLDSFTKLSLGTGAPTDAQIKIITEGKSVRDWAQELLQNRAVQGGILSPAQREQIHTIAGNVFREYQKQYQPVYEEAHRKMDEAGVPKPFQSSMPDLNGIIARSQQPQAPIGPIQIQNEADYNKLPSGAQYIDPNGRHRIKK